MYTGHAHVAAVHEVITWVGQYVRPLDCMGIVHASLPELCSVTAHIVCMAAK